MISLAFNRSRIPGREKSSREAPSTHSTVLPRRKELRERDECRQVTAHSLLKEDEVRVKRFKKRTKAKGFVPASKAADVKRENDH